jgi:hypothetical protein
MEMCGKALDSTALDFKAVTEWHVSQEAPIT